MRLNLRTGPILGFAVLILFVAGGATASAKKRSHPKGPHPKAQSARSAVPPTVLALWTQDTNGRGHINAIRLRLSKPPQTRGLASAFRVAGYQITVARATGDQVELELVSHSSYDTGARPAVTITGLRSGNGKPSATEMMTPADGAAPVLVSAFTANRGGTGNIDAIDLLFSEPVIVSPGAVQVQGYQVQGYRDYPDGELTVLLGSTAQSDTAGLPTVTLNGAELRDGAGNRGPSGQVGLGSATAPVMVGAQDEGFWLDGEKIITIWSAPVHLSGSGGAGSFSMSTAQGKPIAGTALAAGDAPNEIAVDLPLASETPSLISYTGSGTAVLDPDGHAGLRSQSSLPVTQSPPQFAGTLTDPFNQNEMLPFGERSFYLQPWRSYMDTFPATRMLHAVGINFNVGTNTQNVDSGAQLLHDAGFTHARIDIPWNEIDYTNPSQIGTYYLPSLTNELHEFAANGIRPLILLDSNQGVPCPVQSVTLNVTASAPAGATTLQLDSSSAALVQPGLTGLYQYGMDAGVIITSVNTNDLATLSQPLQSAIAAGPQSAVDLAFQPFFPPYNADGSVNATNQATMAGWLQYVAGVTQTVKSILGNDNFDVEVWNEISFGSAFLSAGNYYNPAPAGSGNINQELLQDTVNYIRNPGNGLPDVGLGDGFTNEDPFTGGASEIPGVTALDKHPYSGATVFPNGAAFNGVAPVDALGAADGTQVNGVWQDTFVPTFTSLFPEYFLDGIQTETVTRDLAPFLSDIYGGLHGRFTHPPGGAAPQMWVTEVNLDPDAVNSTLTSPTGGATSPMSAADIRHFETKAILRYLASWVGKGVSQIDFYAAANANDMNLIDPAFWTAAQNLGGYPGLSAGGETIGAVSRFLDTMSGAQNLTQISPLTLDSISDYQGAYQFLGNGTAAYPALYNRNMIGFFPFQVSQHKWVIPTYVMTLNLATLYNSGAPSSDVTRQDMPPEVYRLTLSGLNPSTACASATDPLTGASVPVKIVGRGSDSLSLEIPLTDSPRMLTLTDG